LIARAFIRWAIRSADPASVPILAGPLKGFRLPAGVVDENLGMLLGRYEANVVSKILSLQKPVRIAYDVGAHVGYMALALARPGAAERVFAFEPAPANFSRIRELIAINRMQDRIQPVPLALADRNGPQRLFSWRSSAMFLLESALDEQRVNREDAVAVEARTLDSFVFDDGNPPPDLIKIDVEGAEHLVIDGAARMLQTNLPRILMEIHGPRNAQKVWERLVPLRYEWWHLGSEGREIPVGPADLPPLFSKDAWTAHFFMARS
jgi:FkbM family methyltransferase